MVEKNTLKLSTHIVDEWIQFQQDICEGVQVEQETQIHTKNEYPMTILQGIMCNEQVEANISVGFYKRREPDSKIFL